MTFLDDNSGGGHHKGATPLDQHRVGQVRTGDLVRGSLHGDLRRVAANASGPAGVVLAGVTDMSWPGAWDGLDPGDVTIGRLADEDAAIDWCQENYGPDGSRYLGGDIELAPADVDFMADETKAAGLVASIAEAFRQGVGGYAQDATVQAEPWSFDPGAITVPIRVLHGEVDTIVPVAHGRHTAALIPGAVLETFPDYGHLSMFTESRRSSPTSLPHRD